MGATSGRGPRYDRADTHAAETEQAAFRLGHGIRLGINDRTGHVRAHRPQRIQVSASSNSGAASAYSLYGTAPGTLQRRHGTGKAILLARRALPKRFMTARSEASGRPRPISGLRQCCATNAAAPSVTHPSASPSVFEFQNRIVVMPVAIHATGTNGVPSPPQRQPYGTTTEYVRNKPASR